MKLGNKFLLFGGIFILTFSLVFAVGQQGNGVSGQDSDGSELSNMGQEFGQALMTAQGEMVRDGSFISEGGERVAVSRQAANRIRLSVGNRSVDCDCNLTQEMVQNRTRLYMGLLNGRNAEVKIMPDRASNIALQRLRLKNCNESNNCSIELREVGAGNQTRAAYTLRTQRSSRFLGMFSARMNVEAEVDAETGDLIGIRKPWWAFLASESEE